MSHGVCVLHFLMSGKTYRGGFRYGRLSRRFPFPMGPILSTLIKNGIPDFSDGIVYDVGKNTEDESTHESPFSANGGKLELPTLQRNKRRQKPLKTSKNTTRRPKYGESHLEGIPFSVTTFVVVVVGGFIYSGRLGKGKKTALAKEQADARGKYAASGVQNAPPANNWFYLTIMGCVTQGISIFPAFSW